MNMLQSAKSSQKSEYSETTKKLYSQTQLDVIRLIMHYVRTIKYYNKDKSLREIREGRENKAKLRRRKLEYEKKSEEEIKAILLKDELEFKFQFSDPFFDEALFFSNNRDRLLCKILSCFLHYSTKSINEKHLIAYIENKKIEQINNIKESPLLYEIRKIVYILIECGIITQCVSIRAENSHKDLNWRINTEGFQRQFENAKAYMLQDLDKDIKDLSNNTYYCCPFCNEYYSFSDMMDKNGRCARDASHGLLQPKDSETTIAEKQEDMTKLSDLYFNIDMYSNFIEDITMNSDPLIEILANTQSKENIIEVNSDTDIEECDNDIEQKEHISHLPKEQNFVDSCASLFEGLNTNNSHITLMQHRSQKQTLPFFSDMDSCFNASKNICLSAYVPIKEIDPVKEQPKEVHCEKDVTILPDNSQMLSQFKDEQSVLLSICASFRDKFAGTPLTYEQIMIECQKINPLFLELNFKNMIAPNDQKVDILGQLGAKPITFLIIK